MVKIYGKSKFFENIDTLSRINFPNVYKSFMKEVTTYALRETLTRTPIDTGFLRASGSKKVEKVSSRGAFASISFKAPYAIYVHEILSNFHPIGEAKFLERAIIFLSPLFPRLLKRRIAAVLNKRKMKDIRASRP